jgi:hypothetical protein
VSRRWRTTAVLAIGVIVMATPASDHITSSVTHVADPWGAQIRLHHAEFRSWEC